MLPSPFTTYLKFLTFSEMFKTFFTLLAGGDMINFISFRFTKNYHERIDNKLKQQMLSIGSYINERLNTTKKCKLYILNKVFAF